MISTQSDHELYKVKDEHRGTSIAELLIPQTSHERRLFNNIYLHCGKSTREVPMQTTVLLGLI
jgi:hypothetical protein